MTASTKPSRKRSGKPPAVTERYYDLVRQFPLVPIAGEAHLDAALAMIDGLLREALDAGGQAYLAVLSDQVANYEEAQWEETPATPADRLRSLMDDNGLTQLAFAAETGIGQSTVSEVLTGKRTFTTDQMRRLGQHFRLSPGYFLGTDR